MLRHALRPRREKDGWCAGASVMMRKSFVAYMQWGHPDVAFPSASARPPFFRVFPRV